MRKIYWNYLAYKDYLRNINYLIEGWSETEAQEFIDDVYDTEYILAQGNIDFQDTDLVNIKRCVISKQITLFYKVIDNNTIEFLRFWNNFQDKAKLQF